MDFQGGIRLYDVTGHGNVIYCDGGAAIMDYIARHVLSGSVRFDMVLVLQCTRGSMEADLEGTRLTVADGDMLVCTPGMTLDRIAVSTDFSPLTFAASYERYQESVFNNSSSWNLMLHAASHPLFHLSDNEAGILRSLTDTSRRIMRTNDNRYRRDLMNSVMDAMFNEVCSVVRTAASRIDAPECTDSANVLFRRFIEELEKNGGVERSSSYYADRLCVSVKQLCYVVRKVSGRDTQDWTQRHSAAMIARELRYTDRSMKDLACNFGFPSLPAFYKFVKRMLGASPSDYRKASREP